MGILQQPVVRRAPSLHPGLSVPHDCWDLIKHPAQISNVYGPQISNQRSPSPASCLCAASFTGFFAEDASALCRQKPVIVLNYDSSASVVSLWEAMPALGVEQWVAVSAAGEKRSLCQMSLSVFGWRTHKAMVIYAHRLDTSRKIAVFTPTD